MGAAELRLAFGDDGNAAGYLGVGWSGAEAFGRWMLDAESTLLLPPCPAAEHVTLALSVMPFLGEDRIAAQPLRLLVDGREVFAAEIAAVGEQVCAIPNALVRRDRAMTLTLLHPGARSPAELGVGGDVRRLSLAVRSLTLRAERGTRVAASQDTDRPPVFEVHSLGNLGNRMIQYMVARRVQAAAPGCVLSGVSLDEWGLSTGRHGGPWTDLLVDDEQVIDVEAVAALLRERRAQKIGYRGYGQRLQNFPPLAECRAMFASPGTAEGFGDGDLVINIRGGDALQGLHPDYVQTPPGFFQMLARRTGLRPVLMGQLDDNPYTALLRRAFPDARFVPSRGAMVDFEALRRSRNIVVAVSTFSWLAAWLSDAARVFLPVNGLLNPLQYPDVDLLPLDDPRYEFHLFPVNYVAPADDLARQFERLADTWRRVSPAFLSALLAEARRSEGWRG